MKKSDIRFNCYRIEKLDGENWLEFLPFLKTQTVRDILKTMDPYWSYKIRIEDDIAIGEITLSIEGNKVTRSRMIFANELEIFGDEDNLLMITAKEFGIGKELEGKKVYSLFWEEDEDEIDWNKTETIKKKVKLRKKQIYVFVKEPTEKTFEKMMSAEEGIAFEE